MPYSYHLIDGDKMMWAGPLKFSEKVRSESIQVWDEIKGLAEDFSGVLMLESAVAV